METRAVDARCRGLFKSRALQADVRTLPNGLCVVLLEDHHAPVVAMQTWVRFGSADEGPVVAGIAHVFEHMLFKGTQRFPNGEIASLIEGSGGTVNAWTSYDETVYHVTLSSRFWETGFDVLSDAVLHSLFDADELAREKEVVLEELWRGKDNPDREISERLFQLMFTEHPYRRPVIGFEETVSKLSREDMLRVFNTWYVPNNMIFVAVGDFDTPTLMQAVEARFGSLPAPDLPTRPRSEEPLQCEPRISAFTFQAEMARIEFAFPGVASNDPHVPVLDLLGDLMGNGYNSVLYTALKRKRDIAHDVFAYSYTPLDRGMFSLGASCLPEYAPEVIRALLQQVRDTPTLALSDAALAAAKTRIISGFVHARETYQGIAEQLGRCTLTYNNPNYGEHYVEAISAVTLDDLHQTAAAFLDLKRANIAVLMPEGVPLPDRETVLAWMQQSPQPQVQRSYHYPITTDTAAQLSVIELSDNRKLIVQTDRKAPLVSVRVMLDGGQRVEPVDKAGLVRLLTTVWDRGTETRSASDIEHDIDRLGATFGAIGDRDSLQMSARFLKETFVDGMQLFFDVLTYPTFLEHEVIREQADQLRELEALRENRFAYAFQQFLAALYGQHPYSHLSIGRREELETVSRDDLIAFHQSLLQSHQTVFSVVGDVTVDEVLPLFQHQAEAPQFGNRHTTPLSAPALSMPSQAIEQVMVMEGQQTHIVWGFPTVTLHDPNRYALRLLDTILGGMGGRLFVELRDQKSLAYTVTTLDTYPINTGFLALYIGCSPEKEVEVLDEFQRVVHDVQRNGVTEEELARAKTYLEGVLDIGMQGTSQRTAVYGLGTLQMGKWNAYQSYLKALQNVTCEDVQRAAQTYLNPDRSARVIIRASR
jgi:zinc protease